MPGRGVGTYQQQQKVLAPIQENPDTRHAALTPTEEKDARAHLLRALTTN